MLIPDATAIQQTNDVEIQANEECAVREEESKK